MVVVSDLYEEPRAVLDAVAPAQPSRQRRHGLPRPRPRRARASRSTSRQPTRTWRAASASRWCRTRCASSTAPSWPSTSRASSRVLGREPHRLRALRHVEAARPRAVQLPLAPRSARCGCADGLPHPRLPRRPRRPRHPGARPPHQPPAQRDGAVPVADVPAEDPLPVGAAAEPAALAAVRAALRWPS